MNASTSELQLPGIANDGLMNELIFILTTRCNQQCEFCCEPPGEPDMDTRQAIAWLEAMKDAGIPWVDFSGGEPLVHPEAQVIIQAARDIGLLTTLSTNGLLAKRHLDHLMPFVDQWNISLHGIAETHDRLVSHRGSHKTILDACRAITAVGGTVHITYVVTPANIGEISESLEAMAQAGVRKICFNYVFPRGNGRNYLQQAGLPRDTAVSQVSEAIEAAPLLPITVYHNMNLDGQCALVRCDGRIWGVPMQNGQDFEIVFSMNDVQQYARRYPYMSHHRQFTRPRLGPVENSGVAFPMRRREPSSPSPRLSE